MEQHLTDYLLTFYRHKGRITFTACLVAVVFYAVSFLLPRYYEARISVLPAPSSSNFNLTAMQPMLPLLGISETENKAEIYLQILKSRTVGERILQRFDLKKVWQISSNEKALRRLARQTSMMATREGMIVLAYEERKPELAAQIANAYIAELDRVNQEKNTSQAHSARLYIENQLQQTEQELAQVARDLADFRLQHKTIDLEEQLKAAIAQAGELKGQIISRQVQLGILRQNMKAGNPQLQALETELQQLQGQFDQLQFGGNQSLTERKDFYVAFSEAPEVELQLAELLRQVKIKETVTELLNQQYYQARIEETKDTPTIQVLDEAKPPERKSRPYRLLIAVTGFILGGLLVTLRLSWQRYRLALAVQQPEEYRRWQEFRHLLSEDWARLRRRRKLTNMH